jgi:hypothetical protein
LLTAVSRPQWMSLPNPSPLIHFAQLRFLRDDGLVP